MKNTRYCSQVTAPALTAAPASASTAAPASVAPSNVHLHHTGQVTYFTYTSSLLLSNSEFWGAILLFSWGDSIFVIFENEMAFC